MAILNVRDALDYIRLCDGDEDLRSAVEMVDEHYTDLKERHDALQASFVTKVKNTYDGELLKRDNEIKRLKERVKLDAWRLAEVRGATSAYPEDEDDE